MSFFKNYLDYINTNPEGYWFKRKLYGWGWFPAKTQGWVTILVFILFIFINIFSLKPAHENSTLELTYFMLRNLLLVILLIFICYKKGEKPKWQWGKEK